MSREAIEQLELNIKDARKMVEMGKTIERLRSNADFKKVILERYMEEEAIRLVHLKSDPNMQDEESQKHIEKQMDAIGSLTQFFNMMLHQAYLAQKAIEDDEQTREELLQEDLDNE